MKTRIVLSAAFAGCISLGMVTEWSPLTVLQHLSPVSEAKARIGRPATPGSVAGVARRTTRRHIRRSTIYVASLPRGCTRVVVDGASLYLCGTTYYQRYNNQYVVVYVN